MNKIFLFSFFLLAACNTVEAARTGFEQDSLEIRQKASEIIYPEGLEEKRLHQSAVTTRDYTYCYKSIADVTCYNHEIPGKENLLVGK